MDDILKNLQDGTIIDRIWDFGDFKAHMGLLLEKDQLKLRGDFQIDKGSRLDAVVPDIESALTAISGRLKIMHCRFGLGEWMVQTKTGLRTHFKGDIIVGMLWESSRSADEINNIDGFVAHDDRIEALFGSQPLESLSPYDKDFKSIESVIGPKQEIWVKSKDSDYVASFKNKPVSLTVKSSVGTSASAYSGSSSHSIRQFVFEPEETIDYLEALEIAGGVEDIISLLTLSPFAFNHISLFAEKTRTTFSLLWHKRKSTRVYHPEGPTGLVLPLMSEADFKKVFENWFDRNDHEKMATTLFIEAIKSKHGYSRFAHLVQAFEVLGRDIESTRKFPKKQFRDIVESVSVALSEVDDEDYKDRILELISSSNKESYQDTLVRLLSKAEKELGYKSYRPLIDIARDVSDLRNLLVHMKDTDIGVIQEGFDNAYYESEELMFWFLLLFLSSCDLQVSQDRVERARLNHEELYQFNFWLKRKALKKAEQTSS